MSPAPGPGAERGRPRTRTAAVAVGLLVLVLVGVLVGLLSPGTDRAGPARTATATPTTPTGAPTSARSAPAAGRDPETGLRLVALRDLPRQAQETVALVEAGGPFPYAQDGATFGNYERQLPDRGRGWYREYTVRTPGERDRGPRRIVTGDHDRQVFYTADHYATFVRVVR